MKRTLTFKALGHTLTVKFETYTNNGRLAVELFDEEGPCTTLSCNLPSEDMQKVNSSLKTGPKMRK